MSGRPGAGREPHARPSASAAVAELAEREHPRVIALRRELHQHPELSYQETRTAARVEAELRAAGVQTSRPTATSVVGRIRTGRDGPVLVLRADLDALPVQEETGLPYASRHPGVMHACGHDGHAAVLIGVARALASVSEGLAGEVRLVFQHAEEPLPSGAPELIERGVLDGADAVVGQHLWTPLASGTVAVPAGPLMASTDYFEITIVGRGGHAGLPHEVVDPIAVGAQVVSGLQQLATRVAPPTEPLVVAVTAFSAGEHAAVVPDTATLRGTLRTFDESLRRTVARRIEEIARGTAATYGADARTAVQYGSPAVVNDPALAASAQRIVRTWLGEPALAAVDPVLAGEDFAWYQQHVPGVFFLVGAGPKDRPSYPHHHPRFDIEEQALAVGLRLLLGMALEVCGRRP